MPLSAVGLMVWLSLFYVDSDFIISPGDVEIGMNENFTVDCQTSTGKVRWKHCTVDPRSCKFVNIEDAVDTKYVKRFTLNDNCTVGQCCLTIRDVQPDDAGEYCCIEKDGRGDSRCFNLTVIIDMTCENDVHNGALCGTRCNLPSDIVHHTCTVSYKGFRTPTVAWEDFDGNSLSDQSPPAKLNGGRMQTIFNQTATGKFRTQSVTCRSSSSKLSCSSVFECHYAYDSTMEATITTGVIECTANASGPCSYKWISPSNLEFNKSGSTLDFTTGSLPYGEFRCIADCVVKSSYCETNGGSLFHVTTHDGNKTTYLPIMLAYVVTSGVACIILVLSIQCTIWLVLQEDQRMRFVELFLNFKLPKVLQRPRTVTARTTVQYLNDSASLLTVESKIVPVSNSAAKWIKVPRRIRGITVVGNFLFLIREWSTSIEKFSLAEQLNVCSLLVEGLNSPWSLVKDTQNRFLYISKYDNRKEACIFKVELREENHVTTTKLAISPDFRSTWVRVSVTENNNLLICGFMISKLEEYKEDGELLRTIDLPSSIVHPQQAVMLNDGLIVVVHGWEGGDMQHRVCKLDPNKDGNKIIGSYGNNKNELNTPTDVIVSGEGYIFVPDHNHNRVLLLDQNLNLQSGRNVDKIQIYRPCRLALDEAEYNLYVVEDSDNGNVMSLLVRDLIKCSETINIEN